MYCHAKPVSSFLAAHGLDAFGNRPHVFPSAHRGESAEKQAQHEREILGYTMAFFTLHLVAAQPDTRL
jgi:hypothetical protein